MAYVRLENISFSYGSKNIVSNLNLEVNDGEIMGIIGPSGSGKTTIIRLLCGFIKPESGAIYIDDTCVFDSKRRINIAPERRNIGVVFQDYAVWPHLTVLENVMYPLKKRKVKKEKRTEIALNALKQVQMEDYAKHIPSQLSGGQQQRVAIARALIILFVFTMPSPFSSPHKARKTGSVAADTPLFRAMMSSAICLENPLSPPQTVVHGFPSSSSVPRATSGERKRRAAYRGGKPWAVG